MRFLIVSLGLAMLIGHATVAPADPTRTTFDIWPGKPPGEVGTVRARSFL
jgi:hypothetical protein